MVTGFIHWAGLRMQREVYAKTDMRVTVAIGGWVSNIEAQVGALGQPGCFVMVRARCGALRRGASVALDWADSCPDGASGGVHVATPCRYLWCT